MPSPLSQPVLGAAPTGQQPTLMSAFTTAPVAHAAESDNYLESTAGQDMSMPPAPPAAAYILHDYSDATVAPDPADLNDRGDIVKTKVRGSADDDRALAPEPTGIRKLLRTRRRKVAACCAVFVLLLLIFLAIAYWVILPKIPGSIALPSLGGGSSSSSSLLSMLKDLRVEVMTGKRINIKTTIGVSLPLSLDIGFVSFNLAFDRMTLAKVSINGIKTASDKPDISLDVDLFIQDPPELQADLARFAKDVMAKKADLNYFVGIGALRFGKDPAKPIETFALVQIDLPLSALGITGASLGGMMSSGGSSLPIKFGGVKDIKVATQPGDRVSVDLVANLELPFKVTLIIPYISLRLKIDDLQILTVEPLATSGARCLTSVLTPYRAMPGSEAIGSMASGTSVTKTG
ncbi:hypothetical protein AMAG_14713 [Allomyces macrogynus ATCC 38327]|uniref:Uncharacterized protein n=1 Tax=Allomyces macrogynus (strain ATCC 38327) TaxID=578462 RepID=A0A0L0T766_ALLM3|nr:hypothetical protein AMAG_14713 [Allomyces macrogynus ATCC 38327]|eukprot:KNE70587.1 hypothetical protein AMAG_14713 [Allomyces macrogynus ATCC 38327]